MQPLEIQIRHEVGRYLTGEISLRDLRGWLVAHAWDVKPGTPEGDLVAEIELTSAEANQANGADAETRARLRPLVGEIYLINVDLQPRMFASSSSQGTVAIVKSIAEDVGRASATKFEFGCTRHEVASV